MRGSFLVALATLVGAASAFYLPGIAPMDYDEGMLMEVFANKLTSSQNHVPYDYFSLAFCKGPEGENPKHLSLGQLLMGERSEPTAYTFNMLATERCKLACVKKYGRSAMRRIARRVRDEYYVRLNLDNLPVIARPRTNNGLERIELGYPIGYKSRVKIGRKVVSQTCLFNHLRFSVLYHSPKLSTLYRPRNKGRVYRVVGFEVKPMSVLHKKNPNGKNGELQTCPVSENSVPMCIEKDQTGEVVWTYDVVYKESPLQWATRWDPLLKSNDNLKQIQWFSIVNSLMIALFLTAMVAMILLRTVYLDFARYNNIDDDEEIQEESGWKLIHGDVFRPPQMSGLLCVLVGSGAQILCMSAVTLLFALLGFLSPANRGGLLTAMLSLWVFSSTVCGYYSARIYSGLSGTNKKSVTLGSAFLFSGAVFIVFFFLNFVLWVSGSTGAVPFLTLLLLLVMWFGISVPLNVIGAFIGYKRKAYEYPVRTNQIPREIPNRSAMSNALFCVFSGILPFGVVFMELVFILNSIWQNELFYFFGFLAVVFLILVVTCAEVSIVLTYLQLSKESYHWWWASFLSTASSGAYVFAYSIVYLFSQKDINGVHVVSTLLYSGYMLVGSFAFALATGCIGFLSSFKFVRKIYSSVHID